MVIQYSSQPSIYIYMYVGTCIYICLRESVNIHVCTHTCMYICTSIYASVHTLIYTENQSCLNYLVVVLLQCSAEELEMIYPMGSARTAIALAASVTVLLIPDSPCLIYTT